MEIPRFDRRFFDGTAPITRIGAGEVGGKARGLILGRRILQERLEATAFPAITIDVPRMVVIATDIFEQFVGDNALDRMPIDDLPDARIAHAFQTADLPIELVGDLRALVERVRSPLAIRSSSRLEDARDRPFAGVYATKMIPNNHFDPDTRFRRLVEAIKFVYASTWFGEARDYLQAAGHPFGVERMAVIVQEIVGREHRGRFYPDVSGVARSWSFYPIGGARPEEGAVDLAIGLGKTIVDGGVAWTYSPASPARSAPFADVGAMMSGTQTTFWAVNMDHPPAYDPIDEIEFMVSADLEAAEADGTLRFSASTYDVTRDRLSPGIGVAGPRILNFAPLLVLEQLPLNAAIRALLDACARECASRVEIEFAMTIDAPRRGRASARLGFLQVRPLADHGVDLELDSAELQHPQALVASESVMGNGTVEGILDVVYVRPDRFDPKHTREIAREIETLNRDLGATRTPYLLMGFGRWGSSHPTLGIPVTWSAISGARAIVEAMTPSMNVEASGGSHFFHNLSSFRVGYFTVPLSGRSRIDWPWLEAQPAKHELTFVRHVRLGQPLTIRIDGRSRRGVVVHGD